ncbi:hypothetical protein RUM43_013148 [Polyplax serrata]|uniref:Peptidase S1 domain-containing protein n=1 Tax=Polyplax serrata TaxID=468196 RepID=A0AAN8S2Z8_POLSC
MKAILGLFLCFSLAFARQPSVSHKHNCPNPGSLSNYIINGEDAPDGKYPYMLSLFNMNFESHLCGASILSKNWALTAAHCCAVGKVVKLSLYAGSNVLYKGGSFHEVEKYIIHQNYSSKDNWINDACLLKVKEPFVYGERVQQVTLPPQDWPINDGDLLNVTGWGLTEHEGEDVPELLQLGKNFVALSPEKCESLTEANHPSYLCVLGGREGQGVCNGDSGSPIVKNGVQVGIASWVFTPCGCGLPDFYARVPHLSNWIKNELGPDAKELKFHKEK